jgi:hypothetical protein
MWKLRGCARCNGDVYINRDEYGWFVQCLQCGYHSELVNIDEARKQMQLQSQAQHVSVDRKLKPED